jgi:hypothetical protein
VLSLVFASPDNEPEAALDQQVVISDPEAVPLVFGWRTGDEHWLSLPELVRFRFRPGSTVVTAYPAPEATSEDVMDAYYSAVLPMVVQIVLRGQSLHASAVVTPEGQIVALCGPSQSGKTTVAVALSRRGCGLWADDTVAFEVRADGVTALRLPFELNLREPSAAYFDGLPEDATPHANGHPLEWAQARLGAFCVLERLEDPQGSPMVERLSPREALIALLSQSFRFKPQRHEEKRRMMHDYLEAVAQLPVFRLRYRAGFETLPAVIGAVEKVVLGSVAGREL